MALNRFIYWKKGKRPTDSEIELILRNYVGRAGKVVQKNGLLVVTFPGTVTMALRGIPHISPGYQASAEERLADPKEKRWFEVFHGPNTNTYVKTRLADDFTCVVADGFANLLCLFYKAKLKY